MFSGEGQALWPQGFGVRPAARGIGSALPDMSDHETSDFCACLAPVD